MKYCCTETERKGTCYQQFKKGKFDDTFWSEDSLLLYDDYVDELHLYELLIKVVPNYDRYGITEVNKEEWEKIFLVAEEIGGETKVAIDEINIWAKENFKTESIFTILGI